MKAQVDMLPKKDEPVEDDQPGLDNSFLSNDNSIEKLQPLHKRPKNDDALLIASTLKDDVAELIVSKQFL